MDHEGKRFEVGVEQGYTSFGQLLVLFRWKLLLIITLLLDAGNTRVKMVLNIIQGINVRRILVLLVFGNQILHVRLGFREL